MTRPATPRSFEATTRSQVLPNWRMTHLYAQVLPSLLEHGVSKAQLETMLVTNPAKILGNAKNKRSIRSAVDRERGP